MRTVTVPTGVVLPASSGAVVEPLHTVSAVAAFEVLSPPEQPEVIAASNPSNIQKAIATGFVAACLEARESCRVMVHFLVCIVVMSFLVKKFASIRSLLIS
jgi:hypothetical protein